MVVVMSKTLVSAAAAVLETVVVLLSGVECGW